MENLADLEWKIATTLMIFMLGLMNPIVITKDL